MECYTSRVKIIGLLGLTCLMAATCYFCTTLADPFARVIGWAGVGFFGLGFIALPVMFFRTGPQVIINEDGIEDRRLKAGVIRWDDIAELFIASIGGSAFLCIVVADPEHYLSRLPAWKRAFAVANEPLGFPPLTITFAGLSPGLTEVCEYLDAMGRAASDRMPDESAQPADGD